jgi:hypothetical protein
MEGCGIADREKSRLKMLASPQPKAKNLAISRETGKEHLIFPPMKAAFVRSELPSPEFSLTRHLATPS